MVEMFDSDRGKHEEIDYRMNQKLKNKTEISESEVNDSGGYYESSDYESMPTPDPESKP